MSVLVAAGSKGGAGKTLICQVLSASLAGEMRVSVLDADPTQALHRWATAIYEGPRLRPWPSRTKPAWRI
jgi:cellulose biosynthesis protein BcsQ